MPYAAEVVDVFNLPSWFSAINPLGRVPAVRLGNGEVIVDSTEIHAYLKARHENHALFGRQGASEARTRHLSGLALGIMEYTVGAFLETLRPQPLRIAAVSQDFTQSVERALAWLAGEIRGRYVLGETLSACDLDLGAALGYCDLRLGTSYVDRHPALRAYLKRLHERASFIKTIPPA